MSALDFGAGSLANSTRRYTAGPSVTLPSTGWAIGCWIRHDPAVSGNQVLVGAGVAGAANSVQLCTFAGSQYGSQARDASGSNVSDGINYPAAGDYLLVAQYIPPSDGLRDFLIPKGATVTAADSASSATFASFTPSGWYIGGDGTNWTKLPIGEVFVVGRVLSNAELTTLAAGAPIFAVEPSPLLYWKFRSGAVDPEPNLGTAGSGNATRVGSGYTTTTDFWSEASSVVYVSLFD